MIFFLVWFLISVKVPIIKNVWIQIADCPITDLMVCYKVFPVVLSFFGFDYFKKTTLPTYKHCSSIEIPENICVDTSSYL